MWDQKHLFATCSSGLCNRLLTLAGSMRVAHQTNRQLSLYWPVNGDLGCEFEDLFTNRFNHVTEKTMAAMFDTAVTMKVYNAWKTQTLRSNALSPDGDPEFNLVVIKAWSYPMYEKEPFCTELYNEITGQLLSLTPRDEIAEAARAVSLPDPVIGVHVRRGDTLDVFGKSKDEHFFALMRAMLHRHPAVHFFLATDDAATEETFRREFGSTIISAAKSWRPRSEFHGVREGLIDLLLLSRTSAIIGTHHSSFSRTAGRIGDIHVVIADEVSAENGREPACNVLGAGLQRERRVAA
jgi:hypothetical protein